MIMPMGISPSRKPEALAEIVETIERFWIVVAQVPKVARGAEAPLSLSNDGLIPEDK